MLNLLRIDYCFVNLSPLLLNCYWESKNSLDYSYYLLTTLRTFQLKYTYCCTTLQYAIAVAQNTVDPLYGYTAMAVPRYAVDYYTDVRRISVKHTQNPIANKENDHFERDCWDSKVEKLEIEE